MMYLVNYGLCGLYVSCHLVRHNYKLKGHFVQIKWDVPRLKETWVKMIKSKQTILTNEALSGILVQFHNSVFSNN